MWQTPRGSQSRAISYGTMDEVLKTRGPGFELRISGVGLRVSGCELRISGVELRV